MKELIEFIRNNYSVILSIAAFTISLINLIYLLITNNKNLQIGCLNFTVGDISNKHFYMFNIELINKSRLPISINEVIIKDSKEKYKMIKSPRLLAEKNVQRNGEIIKHQEVHSAKFPINIAGLSSEQKFMVMYGPQQLKDNPSKIIIGTNRGKITKKINLNQNYLSTKDFTEEASEYSD